MVSRPDRLKSVSERFNPTRCGAQRSAAAACWPIDRARAKLTARPNPVVGGAARKAGFSPAEVLVEQQSAAKRRRELQSDGCAPKNRVSRSSVVSQSRVADAYPCIAAANSSMSKRPSSMSSPPGLHHDRMASPISSGRAIRARVSRSMGSALAVDKDHVGELRVAVNDAIRRRGAAERALLLAAG